MGGSVDARAIHCPVEVSIVHPAKRNQVFEYGPTGTEDIPGYSNEYYAEGINEGVADVYG